MEVTHLDMEITDENLKDGIAKILEVLRPTWNPDSVKTEDRSSGYINRNYHCYIPDCSDAFLLRIINTRMPGQIDRAQNAMRYLKRRQLGAQLLLTFTNGLVMEFIEGEVVTWENIVKVKEPKVWLSYAREMAKFHATTNEKDAEEFKIPRHEDSMMMFQAMVEGCLASGKISKELLEGLPTPQQITDGCEIIYKQLVDAGAETKFCHMDANPTNLLIREDRSVVVVDYDDCYMDLPCLEMAGAFGALGGIDDFKMENLPSEEQQDEFLREYLKTRHEIEGKGEVTEKMVEFWKFLLRKSQLHGLLSAVGIVALLQNVSDKPIDMGLCHTFWGIYQADKDKVLAETFSWD